MPQRISLIFIVSFLILTSSTKVFGQAKYVEDQLDSEEAQKPAKFEDFQLGSEKSAAKKFNHYRRFVQNTITHYNYYYNANNKVNLVVDRATAAQKDDYNKLLFFYSYSLDNTASQKRDLDSVILKCTAGILLHDLRSDWVDNMYLLLGEAYFYRKDFDSAAGTFQFINYNLFPREKDEDYNRVVGTNADASDSVISIATREKPNILQKVFSQPPSRNDALIWLARTSIEEKKYGEAAGLINTLQSDPNLPFRLRDDVEELDAYWFYQQNMYDSTAPHLEKALSNARSNQDKARWEFLLGQLYEMDHQFDKASLYYQKASKNTVDPLMDIHAQLNDAKMLRNDKPGELDNGIDNLLHMAKQGRFEIYRDILYYSAAQLAMQKPDTAAVVEYDNKSIHYNQTDISYKNKAYLQLADIAFNKKDYRSSFSDYDSLQSGDTSLSSDMLAQIQSKRNSLSKIVEKLNIIDREDSLQTIAAMQPAEREAFVKKIAKKLQKQSGGKEDEDDNNGSSDVTFDTNNNNQSPDLFADKTKGEWYFYNTSAKAKGLNDFKVKWGKRANTDNWSRKSAVAIAQATPVPELMTLSSNPDAVDTTAAAKKDSATAAPVIQQSTDMSFVGLMSNLPLTPEKLNASNNLVAINLFELAKLYQNDLQDYNQAIATYDQSLARFPDSLYNGELYLGLYFCYSKLGNTARAAFYKNLLSAAFPNSRSEKIMKDPGSLNPGKKDPVVTKQYEDIYNLFIEGNFDEALNEKKKADSLYGTNYWSPQLLYIESIYDIKQLCNDSVAKATLQKLVKLYPASPMKPKAERMISILSRRSSIENYLTNLQVTRYKADDIIKIEDDKPVIAPPPMIRKMGMDTVKKITTVVKPVIKDSIKNQVQPGMHVISNTYTFDSTAHQNVVMLLDKVDPTFVNEAKNALDRYDGENFGGQKYLISKQVVDNNTSMLIISFFANSNMALQYYYKVKKAAPDEISWLPASKYSFFIISDADLQLLQTKKDIPAYKKLLNTVYLNRF